MALKEFNSCLILPKTFAIFGIEPGPVIDRMQIVIVGVLVIRPQVDCQSVPVDVILTHAVHPVHLESRPFVGIGLQGIQFDFVRFPVLHRQRGPSVP